MIQREPGPSRGSSYRTRAAVAGVAIVATAAGLAIVIAGGSIGTGTTATPSTGGLASPEPSGMVLVTVAPFATRTAPPPSDLETASPSPSSTPLVELGIRANRIQIARLGIDLAIIEGDGIDAPIGKAAHYPDTAWPGGGSNIYIYGHARDGMFITLWQAHVGDNIKLYLVDGTSRDYVVTEVLPKVPWNAVQYLEPTKTEQLTLQTSTSNYPTAPRFVVIAVPGS